MGKKKIVGIISVIVCFVIIIIICHNRLWDILLVEDCAPENIDVIFTFLGDSRRFDYSKMLVSKYSCKNWVISDSAEVYKRSALEVVGNDVNIISVTAQNTIGEIYALKHWLETSYVKRNDLSDTPAIVLVSSPFHMRRISMMTKKIFNNSSISFFLLPVPLTMYGITKKSKISLWKYSKLRTGMQIEVIKLIYYKVQFLFGKF